MAIDYSIQNLANSEIEILQLYAAYISPSFLFANDYSKGYYETHKFGQSIYS